MRLRRVAIPKNAVAAAALLALAALLLAIAVTLVFDF
jgi:hypothetical protein